MNPQPAFPASRFLILIFIVILTGFSQGLLLPLLTVLLEHSGISSGMNGLNTAVLYLGVFLTMFFIEKPLARFGYRTMILGGLLLVMSASVLFPLHAGLWFWAALRLLVGIGESSLHYSTQLWIIATSPADRRGRNISFYGMSYATGFSLGPLGINLLRFGDWLPFALIAVSFAACIVLLLRLPNAMPEKQTVDREKTAPPGNRFIRVYAIAWFALTPSFLYGYMESTMNANFPVYGLRSGITEAWVSILLPAIGFGSLILQLPLGELSDRIGRKPVLIGAATFGALAFLAVPWSGGNVWLMLLLLGVAGGLVGSFFSLGLAYMADILPRTLLPAANVIASIHYSMGSMAGPNLGGFGMQVLPLGSMFVFLGGLFLLFAVSGLTFRRGREVVESSINLSV
ncbi:MFS transporter [Paenibacillus cremeus]|uniref:MFS transporter n=1 Tax=Paenibacillus cremeus TaxID=2163881 RepID=A0A559KEI4_9BACL|nr:MFS transporter [Paenibacillus cremeus]TVY10534.1 MFS transporter [Paenibacillus cremeus]